MIKLFKSRLAQWLFTAFVISVSIILGISVVHAEEVGAITTFKGVK